MMMVQIDTIRDGLISTYPEMEAAITARHATVQERCKRLVDEADACLSGQNGKVLVIAHGAYEYLCQDYGIKQLAVESGGKEVTVRALDELIKEAQERGVKTVFSISQHPKQGITRIAQVLHATVVDLNPSSPEYFSEESMAIHAFGEVLKEEQ